MRHVVAWKLQDPYLHKTLNHPDEAYLTYPQNILKDMPPWIRKYLAKNSSQTALNRLVDEGPENLVFEEYDEFPEDEAAFEAQNKKLAKILEEKSRPFNSYLISAGCLKITENIDMLERHIMKRPYVGIMMAYERKLPQIPGKRIKKE